MKVFLTGATGVLGRSAARALLADGHQVSGVARTAEKAATLADAGVSPVTVHLFDVAGLAGALAGFDAVCNLATHIPVGLAAMRSSSWRVNDRLRSEGSRSVVAASRAAGVPRLVQESISAVYAEAGDEWLTENSPISVTRALEPTVLAESNALSFTDAQSDAVVLRFGTLVGDDAMTRWLVSRARAGRPIGFGKAGQWAHLVHAEDAGTAVVAALHTSAGVYNVGADPVRREDMLRVYGEIAGREADFMPRLMMRLAGERAEPLSRSQRVSSGKLHERTGWKPAHPVFEPNWVTPLEP